MSYRRSSRRRSESDLDDFENGEAPSLLERFLDFLTERVARSAVVRFRRGAREAVTWTLHQILVGVVTAAVLTIGIVLLLIAGVKGLEAANCPTWVAYLSAGVLALVVGIWAQHSVLAADDEDDFS